MAVDVSVHCSTKRFATVALKAFLSRDGLVCSNQLLQRKLG
jgi:hypothetical protein